MQRDPWHMLDADEAAVRLGTGPQGLPPDRVRERLERDGPNQLAEAPPTSPLLVVVHQFRSPLIYILVAAALVTLALGEYIDAGVIAAVLALNAVIGYVQERRAEESVRALMRLMPDGRAHHDGALPDVPRRQLTVRLRVGAHPKPRLQSVPAAGHGDLARGPRRCAPSPSDAGRPARRTARSGHLAADRGSGRVHPRGYRDPQADSTAYHVSRTSETPCAGRSNDSVTAPSVT